MESSLPTTPKSPEVDKTPIPGKNCFLSGSNIAHVQHVIILLASSNKKKHKNSPIASPQSRSDTPSGIVLSLPFSSFLNYSLNLTENSLRSSTDTQTTMLLTVYRACESTAVLVSTTDLSCAPQIQHQ